MSVEARTGRLRQRYDNNFRLVSGCIPYRLTKDAEDENEDIQTRIEVLMVSSPNRSDLVFPKGGWENDETVMEAACREALEEAGVRGKLNSDESTPHTPLPPKVGHTFKMPPFINNPLPSSMRSECKKCGRILASFIDPKQAFGPDKVIPPQILANAKGLAILTVFKAGFLGSGRFGSGVVVARLADGSWSAPSAIGTVGGGFGGQIGFELTDFVFILNDASAVKTFAQVGSLTLGGNVSIAAGPVGRNAEAAGAASLKSVSGIFAYSKTKGLFAGVSLEGSVLIERRDANEKMYNRRVTARACLEGAVPVPPAAEPLTRVLNSRIFAGRGVTAAGMDGAMYNDVPVYNDDQDDVVWQGRTGSAYGEGVRTDRTGTGSMMGTPTGARGNDSDYNFAPQRASTWQDDPYDRASNRFSRANPGETFDRLESGRGRSSTLGDQSDYVYSDTKGPAPSRPSAPKPTFSSKNVSAGPGQAVAKFTFDADQPGDLGFKKGEVITIVKRTENEADWWTGRIGNREGIFPSNYVETV